MKACQEDHLGGRYEPLENIAAGNYGSVVKMRDVVTGKAVAVKSSSLLTEDHGFAMVLQCFAYSFHHSLWCDVMNGPARRAFPASPCGRFRPLRDLAKVKRRARNAYAAGMLIAEHKKLAH